MAKRSKGSGQNGSGKIVGFQRSGERATPPRETPESGTGRIHVLAVTPALAGLQDWDLRHLLADWPRRLILIGCMLGFWSMVMDSWTGPAREQGPFEMHGLWVFLPFGKELAGESAFAAGKWLVPALGIAWTLCCAGIRPRGAPPWALTWPFVTVLAMVVFELLDYFETAQQVAAAWAQHPDVVAETPGGMVRFAMVQVITGFGAWRLYRSQPSSKGANGANGANGTSGGTHG